VLYQIIYDAIIGAIEEDPEAEKLIEELGTNLTQALTDEMQGKQTLEKMQSLLLDLLEELKINYVERLSEEDVEELLEQTRRLRQASKQ
jgi:cob(I)alamin adenosyltransferase